MARDPAQNSALQPIRFQILLGARFLVAIACVATLIGLEGGRIFSSPHFKYAYFLLLVVCIVDLLYVPMFRRLQSQFGRGLIQAAVDLLAVTALIYLHDGVTSPFVVLYFGAVLAGAVCFSTAGATLYGALSALLLIGVGALFHAASQFGWTLTLVRPETLEAHGVFQRVAGEAVLPALGFIGVAVLASRLLATTTRERVLMEEILHGMGDGVVTVGGHGRIVFINPAARRLLSLPDDFSPLGQPFLTLLKAAQLRAGLAETDLEAAGSFTLDVGSAHGPQRVLHVTTSPVAGPKGKYRGAVYLLRDLTPQKRMEEVVKKADRLQDISEMAAGIAHEIRNPLASIRGSIQELHTSDLHREDDKRLMKVILKESDRLNNIIEDFLRFAEKQTMTLKACDLAQVLSEVENSLQRRPERGSTAIRSETEGDLTIQAETEGIRQVIFNVCMNGLEAMNGSGSLFLRAYPKKSFVHPRDGEKAATEEADGVAVDIADTGLGIPPELVDRIFHPFFSTKPKGYGMGLAVVHRIVDAHGGQVKVDSRPGGGSTFTLWLPRKPPPGSTGTGRMAARNRTGPPP